MQVLSSPGSPQVRQAMSLRLKRNGKLTELTNLWLCQNLKNLIRYETNVWFIKIRTTHNLSLWLYEYFWIILLYGHPVYFILKVLAWEIFNMKWGFAKKVIIKSQRQFMYSSNFYGSDVISRRPHKSGFSFKFCSLLKIYELCNFHQNDLRVINWRFHVCY